MKVRRVALWLAVAGMLLGQGLAWAQNGHHITVMRELDHETSPPLDKIPTLPPQAGPTRVIPIHLTHGPFAPHTEKADSVLQTGTLSSTAVSGTSQNFLGVGTGFKGPNGTYSVTSIPPDTNGAAGLTQYVQWVNTSLAVFDKATGNPVAGPTAGNALFSSLGGPCASNNSGDPVAQYDKAANRWVLMQPVFRSPYALCIAVSTTSDATGSYYLYAFSIPGRIFPDYPKLGVWTDGYYVTYNQFKGNSFNGPAACVLDRSNMLLGNAATMQCDTSIGTQYGSMLPGDLDGSAAPPAGAGDYFLNLGANSASLDLWQMHVDWSNSANSYLSGPTVISVAPFTEACGGGTCIPQTGTSQQLDSLGDRLMNRLSYRNFGSYESLLVDHSVDTGSGNSGVRWYELRETTPGGGFGLFQQGTYAPDSSYRWMGSIAQDKDGDIAVGYSVSSPSMSPTIAIAGRVPSDTAGSLEPETDILAVKHGSQTNYSRWGDYSSMSIDPADDCTFWYTTEYQPVTGYFWSTRIASFSFPGCTGGSSLTVSSVGLSSSSVEGGTVVTGTVTLSATAPSGGASVTLSSSNQSAATVSGSVTVPSGSTSTTFPVTTYPVTTTSSAVISASYGTSSANATLTVNPPASSITVSSLSLNPSSLVGGNTSQGTVTLTSAAPSGGASVSLSSSNASAASVPASVTVAAGSTSATFNVTTSTVSTSTDVTITASYNSSNAGAILTVNPPAAGDFSISASPGNVTLRGGGTATYNISISSSNGYTGTVNLTVGGLDQTMGAAFSPASITNGSGTSTLTVTTTNSTPRGNYTLTITGTDSSGSPTHSTTVGLKQH